jgi:predicted nucleic acid-binding protein
MIESVVVGTNIVFSAIHTANSLTRQKLLSLPHRFVSCNFLFAEIFRDKERVFKNSRADDEAIYNYLEKVLSRIHFFNEELISTERYFAACHLCKDVDLEDIPFVALAIELNAPLWTHDQVSFVSLRAFALISDAFVATQPDLLTIFQALRFIKRQIETWLADA